MLWLLVVTAPPKLVLKDHTDTLVEVRHVQPPLCLSYKAEGLYLGRAVQCICQPKALNRGTSRVQGGENMEYDGLLLMYHCSCYYIMFLSVQGRIIHEAGEAEASGPEPRTARYNENLQSRTTLGPKISREKICGAVF